MKQFRDFLIIDDNPFDVGHLRAVLHMLFGYEIEIRDVASARDAVAAVQTKAPEVVFADHLSPSDTAFSTMMKLRQSGYQGPVVVITGLADPFKRHELLNAGAADVVIKDDLDSRQLAATLSKLDCPRSS